MLPWREISKEMRLLRVAAAAAFVITAAAILTNAYIESAAGKQPTQATAAYGYPLEVNGKMRYVTAQQYEIHNLAAPAMTWGISAVIFLGGLHVLLDNRQKEADRRRRIQQLLDKTPEN